MAKSAQQLNDPVYDPDDEKPVTRPDLQKSENVSSVPAEQLERIPTMSDEEAAALDEKRGLSNTSEPPSPGASSTRTSSPSSPLVHDNQVGKGYRGTIGGMLNNSRRLRNYALAAGVGGAIITLIIILISFLGVFKLDGLMSNIEQKAFLRHNATLSTRSSKWVTAYVEARMFQIGDTSQDTMLFRSDRVDTNSPFTDWYRTMRASNFEQDVFEKHGIKFVSVVGADGKPRPGKIDISGEKPITMDVPLSDLNKIAAGDTPTISKYQDYLDLEKFDSNKDARRAIKEVVNANTHWLQIYKRRFLRRSIQNMTGVRDWRFFETTRDKITNKKIDIRNRILDKMLPDSNLLGRVARCFYGLTRCTATDDVANPEVQVDATEIEKEAVTDESTPTQQANEAKVGGELDAAGISDALKKVLTAANIFTKILNIPSTLDMLSYINQNLSKLVKLVVIARGAQAAGLFQVFETSRDQIKTGQVNGDEVNAFMQNIDNAASSAGWTSVIGKGVAAKPQTGGACSQEAQALQEKQPDVYQKKYGSYAPLCADQQIGSASNAQTIQSAYDNTIGPVIGPIAKAWGALNSTPIIGQFIGLIRWMGNILNDVISAVLKTVLSALGLQDNVNSAIAWIFAKTSNFLGLSIVKGYESAGTMFNWLLQGGAYSAESTSRQEGAALTTPQTQVAADDAVTAYLNDTQQESSIYDRVASLDNPDSLAFRGATALSTVQSDPSGTFMASLQGMWSNAARHIGSIFAPRTFASSPNGYAASQFAGIKTYDYPKECYDLDPITAQPEDGTNALAIFSKYGLKPSQADLDALNSWDTERSSSKFYQTIYDVIGLDTDNGDDIAEQIYNCNLLDTAVRGSLGYLYGYNADSDSQVIDSGTIGASNPTSSAPSGSVAGYENPLRDVPNLYPKRIDEGVDYGGDGPVYALGNAKIDFFSYPNAGWLGGVFMSYTLKDGPAAGKSIYVAENCKPTKTWKVGDVVSSSTVLCKMSNSSPWIETGWAPGGQAIALAKPVYSEGHATALGVNFDSLMQKVGAPPGTYDYPGETPLGSLPAGWPRW